MEKLTELLNEYEKERNLKSEIFGEKSEFIIISKKFGFIKWLVENEKIDEHGIELDLPVEECGKDGDGYFCKCYPLYEGLLMLLSIQDNPIEFLVSILKNE